MIKIILYQNLQFKMITKKKFDCIEFYSFQFQTSKNKNESIFALF